MAAEGRIYVYAIAEAGGPARMRVHGRALRSLNVGDISLIVERAGADHELTEDALRRQHALVEALAERLDPMLPVRFGTSGSEAELRARTAGSVAVLRSALEHVRGMSQMTVRIQLPVSQAEPPDAESTATMTGTQYLERRRSQHAALDDCARAIAAAAGSLVADQRIDPPSREASARSARGAIYHLVRKRDVEAYSRAVASCAESLEPATLVLTGPFAPFAFAPQL